MPGRTACPQLTCIAMAFDMNEQHGYCSQALESPVRRLMHGNLANLGSQGQATLANNKGREGKAASQDAPRAAQSASGSWRSAVAAAAAAPAAEDAGGPATVR